MEQEERRKGGWSQTRKGEAANHRTHRLYSKDLDFETDRKLLEGGEQMSDII